VWCFVLVKVQGARTRIASMKNQRDTTPLQLEKIKQEIKRRWVVWVKLFIVAGVSVPLK
jgi:hypothetical protein